MALQGGGKKMFIKSLALVPACLLWCGSATAQGNKNSAESHMYYVEKGNKGEILSKGEFDIVIKNLEEKMVAFKKAFSQVNIGDTDISYKIGSILEIELNGARDQLQEAFDLLPFVKATPNLISLSLSLYVMLEKILRSAYYFSNVSPLFEKRLNYTPSQLDLWCEAFQKAHLRTLAMAKDQNRVLYAKD